MYLLDTNANESGRVVFSKTCPTRTGEKQATAKFPEPGTYILSFQKAWITLLCTLPSLVLLVGQRL